MICYKVYAAFVAFSFSVIKKIFGFSLENNGFSRFTGKALEKTLAFRMPERLIKKAKTTTIRTLYKENAHGL